MKRASTIFLQLIIVLIGIGTLALMLWEPHLEGVNANATTLYEIYLDDPFLAYVYVASIPFFVALYQAFMLLRYVAKNNVFSRASVKALRTIKYCAGILAFLIVATDAYLLVAARGTGDDAAGAVALGLLAAFASTVVAAAAAVFEKLLQSAVDIKSENDLTV